MCSREELISIEQQQGRLHRRGNIFLPLWDFYACKLSIPNSKIQNLKCSKIQNFLNPNMVEEVDNSTPDLVGSSEHSHTKHILYCLSLQISENGKVSVNSDKKSSVGASWLGQCNLLI